jgi:hypothetical protein
MRSMLLPIALALLAVSCAETRTHNDVSASMQEGSVKPAVPAWSFNATIIEACSCPVFCQCYFNAQPADHPGCCPPNADPKAPPRYCRFNNAFRVNEGSHVGDVALGGARFWVAGDLGGDFSKGEMAWARLHFDPSVTKAQRDGVVAALGKLYPVKWQKFEVGPDLPIEWKAGKDKSVARLGEGRGGEVVLVRNQGMTDEPIVIKNLRYWGAPRNDGFVMMQNEVEAYRYGDQKFEHKGTNGFMITVDLGSNDQVPGATY